VVTHLDLDHAGGLGDFPDAEVHVHAHELSAARRPTVLELPARQTPARGGPVIAPGADRRGDRPDGGGHRGGPGRHDVQYEIAAGLIGLGVALWMLTWLWNRGARGKRTGFSEVAGFGRCGLWLEGDGGLLERLCKAVSCDPFIFVSHGRAFVVHEDLTR
jgi:hypothetical protein